ncbi:UNVERIFIED_CONTAM: hypothetical protein FKN15_074357 [Acipenser sinensis]
MADSPSLLELPGISLVSIKPSLFPKMIPAGDLDGDLDAFMEAWERLCKQNGHSVADCPLLDAEEVQPVHQQPEADASSASPQDVGQVYIVDEWCPGCGEFGTQWPSAPPNIRERSWLTERASTRHPGEAGRATALSHDLGEGGAHRPERQKKHCWCCRSRCPRGRSGTLAGGPRGGHEEGPPSGD